ncbi:MAG: NAD(P)/FAD-dependent oxidoreductase [Aquificae bacterium]|nr:NAD(P)/FAD-dependent oxidoreductase [Aquificota bacterium]
MNRYDVLIVGGGVSGLSCALTLASAKGKFSWADNKRYLVIDNQSSDLLKAMLNNVPGVKQGSLGREVLEYIKKQIDFYGCVDFVNDRVLSATGEKGNFVIETQGSLKFVGDYLVLATGFHEFNILGLDVEVVPNKKAPRPGKVMIKTDRDFKVKEGLYVAGLLAGVSSMFATASGSGTQVACNIMEEWAGKPIVIHDVPEPQK